MKKNTWVCSTDSAKYSFKTLNAHMSIKRKASGKWRCCFSIPVKGASVIADFELSEKSKTLDEAKSLAEEEVLEFINKQLEAPKARTKGNLILAEKEINSLIDVRCKKKQYVPLNDEFFEDEYYDADKYIDEFKIGKYRKAFDKEKHFSESKRNFNESIVPSSERTIVLIAGPSGSGKTTLAKSLSKFGYEKIVTCTTRPMRQGEVDGVDYFFLTDDEFAEKKDNNEFLETASYRGWNYGTPKNNLNGNHCLVLTPSGVREAKKVYRDAVTIYLDVSRRECLKRLLNRGDDIDEAYRRNLTDVGQFDGFEKEADLTISTELSEELILERVVGFLENMDMSERNLRMNTDAKIDAIYQELMKERK